LLSANRKSEKPKDAVQTKTNKKVQKNVTGAKVVLSIGIPISSSLPSGSIRKKQGGARRKGEVEAILKGFDSEPASDQTLEIEKGWL
jgi:hypothetical protein